jgi:hypothetical protein
MSEEMIAERTEREGVTETDPNTIWGSQFDPNNRSRTTRGFENIGVQSNTNVVDVVVKLQEGVKAFTVKHMDGFIIFWHKMTPASRENFLRDIYPTIVQSLDDRYCIHNCEKMYENIYDRNLILTPIMTVEYLIDGDNLINLFREWASDHALIGHSADLVVQLRRLFKEGSYPLPELQTKKYNEELIIKKGDMMMLNRPDSFGNYVKIDKPEFVTISHAGQVCIYDMGLVLHLTEVSEVFENLHFLLSLLGNTIDEYKDEILGRGTAKLLASQMICANCSRTECKDGKVLKTCAKCVITFYCSPSCQSFHWKPHHQKVCKEIRRIQKEQGTRK